MHHNRVPDASQALEPVARRLAVRRPCGANLATQPPMEQIPPSDTLRGEARILNIAGVLLLLASFPFTMLLVARALSGGIPSMLPLAAGAPFILLGYLLCSFAARRHLQARKLDQKRLAAAPDNC